MATEIKGLQELRGALRTFPVDFEAKVLRGAARAAAAPVRDAARDSAPELDGKLKKSIRVSSKIDRRDGAVSATVKAGGKDAFYAGWVENGTGPHRITAEVGKSLFFNNTTRGAVDHPGAKASPFMRPTFDNPAVQNSAFTAFANYVRKRLTKAGWARGGDES